MADGHFHKEYKASNDPDKEPKNVLGNYRLGSPTSPMHAKQLEEFGKRLNEGVQNIEIGTLEAVKFEYIPKEHFEAIRQLAKLTKTKPSLHGALVDLAGFNKQGRWTEEERQSTTRQVFSFIERAQAMDPSGDLPIVFHAGETIAQEYDETLRQKYKDAGEELKPEQVPVRMITAVNQDTGQVQPIEFEERFNPESKETDIWTPFRRLESQNDAQWRQEKLKLFEFQKSLAELGERLKLKAEQENAILKTGLETLPQYETKLKELKQDIPVIQQHMGEIESQFGSAVVEMFDKVVKFKPADVSKEDHEKHIEEMRKNYNEYNQFVKENKERAEKLQEQLSKIKTEEDAKKNKEVIEEWNNYRKEWREKREPAQRALLNSISKTPTPEIWRPVADFAKEKTAQTVAEAMAKAYKRFGDTTPFVAIENFWPNTPMSTASELKDAVLKSREEFAKILMKENKKSEKDAKKLAEKMIGATWDVGHINNLRKAGFEGEELKKRVIEETQRVADVVRHVHITDNFGFHDSHLPPGMGNVPVREMMEALEKGGFRGRGIVEAGAFVAEIGGNPMQHTLGYFDSPLFKMGTSQYWSHLQSQQVAYPGYNSSFIEFPSSHFNLYGSSFTTLPKELGGQIGGEKSRFSDTSNT